MNALALPVVLIALLTPTQIRSAETFFISPRGKDTDSGTEAKPFATLERARDEIRRRKLTSPKAPGGFIVELAAGAYEMPRALDLTDQDAGAAGAPVIYRARASAPVRLIGGRTVGGWAQVSDPAILARLNETARGQVWSTDLKAQGISDFGEVAAAQRRLEFFFQDQPMTVARWPNEGFIKITETLGPTPVDVRGTKGCQEGLFAYDNDRPSRWIHEADAWVHGYWFWDWSEQRHPIASIDAGKKTLTLKPPYHGYGYRKGQWFYGFNLLCELDRPGEWYLDRRDGKLYFWPPAPLEGSRTVVSVIPTLISIRNAQFVELRGLTLEACRGTAIEVHNGTHITIAACTVRNTGQDAIKISGSACAVLGCDIYATADAGISLTGGDRPTLTPGNLVAENNHIHHISRWDRVYQPGITLAGVGNRAAHNLIEHAPHMALGFSGNDHIIEFNEFHDVCYESNDAGAIYAGRDWTMRGTVVRYNYFHQISGFEGRGCVGVYLDDQFSGTEVIGNLFHQVTRAAMIGGGRDCTIENNVFIDCLPAVHVDARGLGWAASGEDGLRASLAALPCSSAPWSTRYPQLVKILHEDPMAPKGNRIVRNICVGGKWGDFEGKAKPEVRFEGNLLDQDPQFVDAAHGNFQLKETSPAFKLGFKALPIEKMGLRHDSNRVSWPTPSSVPRKSGVR